MIYLYAFLVCGLICAVGQIMVEYTSLNYGDVNTMMVIAGSFLSFLGIYDKLIDFSGAGGSVPITNFGHLLYKGAYSGYLDEGIIGIFKNIFSLSSAGVVIAIILGFLCGLLFKCKH